MQDKKTYFPKLNENQVKAVLLLMENFFLKSQDISPSV